MLARRRGLWAAIGVLGAIAAAGILVLSGRITSACIGGQYDSIHFRSSDPDFGIPPRRAVITWRGEHDDRPQSGYDDGGDYSDTELSKDQDVERRTEIDRKRGIMAKAVDAIIRAGQWTETRKQIERFENRYGWGGGWRDRAEVMQRLETLPAPLPATLAANLRLYLDGLDADEAGNHTAAQAAFVRVMNDPSAGFLREHALYQQASLAAELFDYPRAVDLYEQLLTQYPHTVKREETLVMIARCGLLPQTPEGRRVDQGKAALAQLQKEFPHTRFRRDIVGLRGRLFFIAGQWQQAAHCYYINNDLASIERILKAMPSLQRGPIRVSLLGAYLRALTTTKRFQGFAAALRGADGARQDMTAPQFAQFRQLLLQQPDTASAYLYYRLYYTECKAADRRRLAEFADRVVALHPATQLTIPVQIRLAEVYYRDRQYRRALAWADRALRSKLTDRALYVRAATLNKLGQPDAALTNFRLLTDRFPGSPLVHGARENLAQLYEARHEFGRALDQYFALQYNPDIAYLLDIRMTPAQIAAYLRGLPSSPQYDGPYFIPYHHSDYLQVEPRSARRALVAYSLGIRYLREERWADAKRLLLSVPHKAYLAYSNSHNSAGYSLSETEPMTEPLKSLAALEKLQRAIQRANTPNARASALYHYAAYYTSSDLLLLYNAALWQGDREENFDFYWDKKRASPEERAAVRAHMYAHETYARSHALCMEVIHRYPHSPTVPYALFLAAIDSLHLSRFNRWWDEEDKRYGYYDEVYRLKRRLTREYPHHKLAAKVREHTRIFPEDKNLYWRPQRAAMHIRDGERVANRE